MNTVNIIKEEQAQVLRNFFLLIKNRDLSLSTVGDIIKSLDNPILFTKQLIYKISLGEIPKGKKLKENKRFIFLFFLLIKIERMMNTDPANGKNRLAVLIFFIGQEISMISS